MMPNGTPPIPPPFPPNASSGGTPGTPPVGTPGGHDPFWGAMAARDLDALGLLATFHRIVAGILFAVSLCGLPYLAYGAWLGRFGPVVSEDGPPPSIYGGVTSFVGGSVFFGALAFAVLFWIAGDWIKRRRHHTALIVVEVLLLLSLPHGTALGVYGLYLLTKPHVKAAFA